MSPVKKLIKRFATHRSDYYKDMLLRRVSEKKLSDTLESLGVADGQTLYIQSAFGKLGYYPEGAQRFIRLLQGIIGPKGTIVMPCFPTNGAMEDYVAGKPVFNVLKTPSGIGLLPEVLRRAPGALRSCHPTHSVAALGYLAQEIISGHEDCPTPQGDGSPFDKLVQADARILRIETPANPLTHRLQEAANMPNLFVDRPVTLECIKASGGSVNVETRVYLKKVPFVVFLQNPESDAPVGTNIIDFPILFESRVNRYKNDPTRNALMPLFEEWRKKFGCQGQWRQATFNKCHLDSYQTKLTMDFSVKLVKDLIRQYAKYYNVEEIAAGLAGGSIKL